MIRIISFDLDGTLVKNTYADAVWLEGLPRVYAKEKQVPLEQAKQILFTEYDSIGDQRKEWYDIAWWYKRFHLNGNWEHLLQEYRETVQVFPEVCNVIAHLSETNDLIVLSNAKHEFITIQLEEAGLRPFFSRIFSSISDFDTVKKIPDVYQKVCQLLHHKPQEILHVGDHKEFDVDSPQKIGMHAVFLDRKNCETGNHVIHDLSELETMITTLNRKK
jgi:putative hydrolase of the HAD superfamily